MGKMADVIAALSVSLTLETAAFEKNSKTASKRVAQTGREFDAVGERIAGLGRKMAIAFAAIGGTAVIGQLAGVAKRALDSTVEIGKMAQAAGVSASAFQELSYAASQVGLSTEDVADGLKELTLKIGEAAQGSKSAVAAFEGFGVSIRDANGDVRDASDLLPDISDAFLKLKSPAEQAAFAAQLFGEDVGPKMVPLLSQGSRAIDDYREAAQKLGIVLSDSAIEKAKEAKRRLGALNIVLEAKIASAVSDNADSILELVDALGKLVELAGQAAKAWRYFSNLDWRPGAGSFSQQFQRMQLQDLGPGVELTDSVKAAIAARRDATFTRPLGGNLLTRAPRSSAPVPTQTPWGPLIQQRPGLTRAVGGISGLSAFAPGAGTSDWIKTSQAMASAADSAARISAANKSAFEALRQMADNSGPKLVAVLGKVTPQMEALRTATQNILDRLFPEQAELRQFQVEIATLTAAMKSGQLSTEDYAKAVNALRQEFNGFAAELQAQQEIITTGIGPSLDDFIDQADASWERFSSNLVDGAKVSRVQVVQTFEQMAQDVLNSLSQLSSAIRGGGFLDILSGVISLGLSLGKAGVFGSNFAASLGGVPAFANGTNFAPGGLSIVGERGPELVDLPRGSRVTPNKDLAGMGGIATIVPSPYFDVVVDGRVYRAAPGIASAGAAGGVAQSQRRAMRRAG